VPRRYALQTEERRGAMLAAVALSLPLFLPLAALAYLALTRGSDAWPHLIDTVLPNMLVQTTELVAGVSLVALVIGAVLAGLVTFTDFPGRSLLAWAALLPLAIPGYIVAFADVDFLSYAGALQEGLRQILGWTKPADSFVPDIRSMGGGILVFGLSLYPYVYMTARAAFLKQSSTQIDVARTLGRSPLIAFLQVALPQARPALAVGTALVAMEVLNDIGAVQFFGINSLTLGIFSTWLGQGDIGSAAQMSIVLLAAVALLIWLEQRMRSLDQATAERGQDYAPRRIALPGWRAWAATALVATPVALGFVLPAAILAAYGHGRVAEFLTSDNLAAALHSLQLAGLACVITLLVALFFGYVMRGNGSRALRRLIHFSCLGYGVPGTVLGLGILVSFGAMDRLINWVTWASIGWKPGLLLSGSIAAVSFAYVARFLIVAQGNVQQGFLRISPHLDHAARTLGRSHAQVFRDVHVPLLRPALVAAGLLIFVDALKELPATLLLRPFNFDTLATRVFTLASLGQLEAAALPALAITATGLVPVYLLSRALRDR
jgi:iron(III) transport system permease protein